MKRERMPLYALTLAILIVGLAALGVPVRTLLFSVAALACPLMMIFMMEGMHGGHGHDRPAARPSRPDEHRDQPRAAGNRHGGTG